MMVVLWWMGGVVRERWENLKGKNGLWEDRVLEKDRWVGIVRDMGIQLGKILSFQFTGENFPAN